MDKKNIGWAQPSGEGELVITRFLFWHENRTNMFPSAQVVCQGQVRCSSPIFRLKIIIQCGHHVIFMRQKKEHFVRACWKLCKNTL